MYLMAISHAGKVALTVFGSLAGLFLVLYVALGAVFFHFALGSKRRKDETVPCKNSLLKEIRTTRT